MFQEFFIALFKAGLPVGVAAYLLVWWAMRNGYLGEVETVRDIKKEVKRIAKDKEAKKAGDPVHRKWLSMGGGFYGVVALLTLVHIELGEIFDFVTGFDGIGPFLGGLSIGTLVNLFIETLMNTFTALAWPVYWLSGVHGNYVWIWFIVAYGGYWLGSTLATRRFRERRTESG